MSAGGQHGLASFRSNAGALQGGLHRHCMTTAKTRTCFMNLSAILNRGVIIHLVATLFALCAAFGVVLPSTFEQPAVVATLMLVIAAGTAIVRFGRPPFPGDAKAWWQSKTIWTSIIAALFAFLALFGIVPELDQGSLLATIMAVVGIFNAFLHPTVTRPIS